MTDGCLLNTVFFVSKQRCAGQKRIKLKDSILTYDGLRDSVFMSPLNHSFSETSQKNRAKSKQLSEDEQNLLVKYRELSAKEKNAVIGLCDLLINH